jgi:catechol 2,3-dioxygenase-like lactoylglutathione lyase family enzyme
MRSAINHFFVVALDLLAKSFIVYNPRTMPTISGILETALYVADVARAAAFYESLFGFARMTDDSRFCALRVPSNQVLLLFKQGASTHPMPTSGGIIPPHDGHGQLHLAFSCSVAELPEWESRLLAMNVPIESRVHWDRGGTSIYFRDPDDNLVEIATPGVWPF